MKKVEKSLVRMVHDNNVRPFNNRIIRLYGDHSHSCLPQESGGTLKALVWITHEASQAKRVGTREFDVSAHTGSQSTGGQ